MRPLKPVTLTKRQIDNALEKLFDIDAARIAMSHPVYNYAWTIWASRHDILALQGDSALRQSKRKTKVLP